MVGCGLPSTVIHGNLDDSPRAGKRGRQLHVVADLHRHRVTLMDNHDRQAQRRVRHQLVTEEASAHHRVNPELFTAAGINIDTLFTEDGALDHNKVTDTCAEIREKFGIPEQKKYRDNPLQGSPARDRDAASWADAFLQQNGH